MPESNLNTDSRAQAGQRGCRTGPELAWQRVLKGLLRALLLFLFSLSIAVPDGIAESRADTAGKTGQQPAAAENKADAVPEGGEPGRMTQSALGHLLAQMTEAYEAEDAGMFMAHVAGDFTGGRMLMDAAVRDDFSFFDNIDLQVSISNFAAGDQGYIYISVTYARRVTSARSGRTLQDSGLTEMVFKAENRRPRLYALKNPLLFGLSDAENVASGTVNAGRNVRLLVVDDSGEAAVLPFDKAMSVVEGTGNVRP